MSEKISIFSGNNFANFNEPDILFEKQKIDIDSDSDIDVNKNNTKSGFNKVLTPYSGYPFDKNADLSKRPNDVVLQNQNVILADKVKNLISNKISSSRYQNDEINRMYDKLQRLTILKNIENNISKKKSLFDISLKDLIHIILTDWINIFNRLFDNNFNKYDKINYILQHPISVGVFFIFISICVFLSFY